MLFLNRIEAWLFFTETWKTFAALSVEMILLLVPLLMLGCKLAPRFKSGLVNQWAYRRSRLLRITQSPIPLGFVLIFGGFLLGHLGALYPSPFARSWAYEGAIRQAAAKGKETADLREHQETWNRLLRFQAERGEKFFWSLNTWDPRELPPSTTREMVISEAEKITAAGLTMEVGAGLLIIVGLVLTLRLWTREAVGERHHGRASWAARSEVTFDVTGYFRIPMRVSQRGTREWEKTRTAPWTVSAPSRKSNTGHGLIVGPTGAGKGAFSLGHVFATARVPIVYQDAKGETPARALRPWMLRFGIPAKAPKGFPSMRFNPLEDIHREGLTDDQRADRALTLAGLLIPLSEDADQNKWIAESAHPVLAEGLLSGRWNHFGELADEVAGMKLPAILKDLGLPDGWMFSLEGKNAMEYAANEISNNTQPYLRGWARHAFSASDFTLEEAFQRGLYVMSATEDPRQKIPIKLFWNLLWAEAHSSDHPIPCLVLIDEAIAAGKIPGIIEATAKLRDRGFSIWMAFQTYAGIETVYGRADADTLRRTLVNSIILTNGMNPKDADEVVQELASYTHSEKNNTTGQTTHTPFPLLPKSDLLELAGQENEHWAIIRGRGVSSGGRAILAKLNPMNAGLWNCLADPEEYAKEAKRYAHGDQIASRYAHLLTKNRQASTNPPDGSEPSTDLDGL